MKKYLLLLVLVFVGVIAWQIGEKLSSDAISMGLGVMFGVLAGVPTAILVLAGDRRRERADGQPRGGDSRMAPYYPQLPAQPPVIVLTGQGMAGPQQAGQGYAPYAQGHPQDNWSQRAPSERRFKVVGEKEEWIDEW